MKCPNNQLVKAICGSANGKHCSNFANVAKCCSYPNINLASSKDCKWEWESRYGYSANCGEGYVQRGTCGSGSNKDCLNSKVHGAYCCPLKNKKGTHLCL